MKKKIALFILIIFTIVCFSGCSKEENTQTEVNTLDVNRTSTDITNISLNNLSILFVSGMKETDLIYLSNNIVSNSTSNEISIPNTTNSTEEILARFFY